MLDGGNHHHQKQKLKRCYVFFRSNWIQVSIIKLKSVLVENLSKYPQHYSLTQPAACEPVSTCGPRCQYTHCSSQERKRDITMTTNRTCPVPCDKRGISLRVVNIATIGCRLTRQPAAMHLELRFLLPLVGVKYIDRKNCWREMTCVMHTQSDQRLYIIGRLESARLICLHCVWKHVIIRHSILFSL